MWRILLISVVVFPTIILSGCATTPSYQAKFSNRNDKALISNWKTDGFITFTYTEVEKVDGQRLSWPQDEWKGWSIDPGMRVLSVAGTYAGGFGGVERHTGRAELNATLKAGHTYAVKAERNGEIMLLWVEDQETNEVVSEKKSTTTTHWVRWF